MERHVVVAQAVRSAWRRSGGQVTLALCLVVLPVLAAQAQEPVRQVLSTTPPLVDAREASEDGPPELALSVVGRTAGVPAVLHAVRGTATAPLSALVVENSGVRPLTGLVVAVTWIPPDGSSRRRVLTVPATLALGATTRVALRDLDAVKQLVGATGTIEVALAGVMFADGGRVRVSPGFVWATGQTVVGCADEGWQLQPAGTDAPDASGAIVRCHADGQWAAIDAERAQ